MWSRRITAAGRRLLSREIEQCRTELRTMQTGTGSSVGVPTAVGWSAATVVWGNAVVLAGRRFGYDQCITLAGVPLFGVIGAWWLCRRRRLPISAIGLQAPRTSGVPPLLSAAVILVAIIAGVVTTIGLATFGDEMRGLRTIRTLVGTAAGEELVHRGVLLTLWAGTGLSAGRVLVANMVVFGAWHLAGATCDGFDAGQIFGPTVGAVLFVWLRLRFRSILAPVAVHALNVFGVLQPLKSPCRYPFG